MRYKYLYSVSQPAVSVFHPFSLLQHQTNHYKQHDKQITGTMKLANKQFLLFQTQFPDSQSPHQDLT